MTKTEAIPDADNRQTGEWQVRTELAAAYRLVALFGWDDLVFTHLSARVPGPEHHFLSIPMACCSMKSPRPH